MRKLQFFIVLALIGSLFSCNQKAGIKGEIRGLGNDTILVRYKNIDKFYANDKIQIDTIYSKNGKFEYVPKDDKLSIFFLTPQKLRPHHITVFGDKGECINIKGKVGEHNIIEHTVTGSELNENHSKITNSLRKENKEVFLLNEKIKSTTDKHARRLLYKKRNKIFNEKIRGKQIEYIKANPNSQYAGFLTGRYFYLDKFEKYYALLTPAVKNGEFASMLNYKKAICEAQRRIVVGKQAPKFKLKTIKGKDFTLDAITNKKYIVLDFWGSWCGACVRGFPKMKEYYQKYKDQIEIVGIDCKDTQEKWEKALKEYQPTWIQVKENGEKTSVEYGVLGYPTKFILDKNHKIVAIFKGEGKGFYEKLDELLKETK